MGGGRAGFANDPALAAGRPGGSAGHLADHRRPILQPNLYIFAWLGFYGGVLGAVAGVLIAGYWVLKRTKLNLIGLYTERGPYWFRAGWSWRALVATLIGALLAVGGAYTAPGTAGPLPVDGLIPFLKPLYDYSRVAGLAGGFLVYLALSLIRADTPEENHEQPGQGRLGTTTLDG